MLRLYNSLTRRIEDFEAINPPHVGMYTCGPTVYSFAHIGNFRTYTSADILHRVLRYNGCDVKYIMNLTDVGHLTGDNLGDADLGEDRMEKAAKREGKTAWEVAEFYTDVFLDDYKKLNLLEPERFVKATEHIKEQIDLVRRLESRGFTYKTSDGVYFDTSKFPKYGELFGHKSAPDLAGFARVEANPEKKNQRDFALWKFSYPNLSLRGGTIASNATTTFDVAKQSYEASEEKTGLPRSLQSLAMTGKRQMEWDSPWGVGFPGWHIECSAMSMKYLGESFDIHAGGTDLRETHHPNEIAEAEAVTGKKFVNYWVHGAFILVSGERMSKSLGNLYTIYDLEKEARVPGGQGYDPMALRYLYLQTHYRQEMNFTFAALEGAQNGWNKLIAEVAKWDESTTRPHPNPLLKGEGTRGARRGSEMKGIAEFAVRFKEAINDDLNMSRALSVVWELVKSDNPSGAKAAAIFKFDEVLGLQLQDKSFVMKKEKGIVPSDIKDLVKERNDLRKMKKFSAADKIRKKISELGYEIEDTEKGAKVRKRV